VELEQDPHGILKMLRAHAPVSLVPDLGAWLVTRWDDVAAVEADPLVFSAAVADSALTRTIGPNMLHSDGVQHQRLRDAVSPVLRPGPLRAWADDTVSEVATRLLDQLRPGDPVDLVTQYAEPLAVTVLQRLVGLPDVGVATMRRWFHGIGAGAANFRVDARVQAVADAASREVDDAIEPLLHGEQQPPVGSLLAELLAPQADGGHLSGAEVLGTVKLMIIGGMQEPRDLVGTAAGVLTTQPAIATAVQADNGLVPRLLEECLRWNSPVGTITRVTTQPIELCGTLIPSGAHVAAALISANRDERRWQNPDLFRLDRVDGPHAAFALGAHTCIGAGLARVLARIAVEALLAMQSVLVPAGPVQETGFEFRGPVSVPVLWH
jgi:cytochrome P450